MTLTQFTCAYYSLALSPECNRVSQRFVQYSEENANEMMPEWPSPLFIRFRVPLFLSRQVDLPLVGHVHTGLPDHELLPLGIELGLQLLLLRRWSLQCCHARRRGVALQPNDDDLAWMISIRYDNPKLKT